MSMFGRLKYLHEEGFEICSLMGYDAEKPDDEYGEGKILYRYRNQDGNWRLRSEIFRVSYDEMQSCSSFYLHNILG